LDVGEHGEILLDLAAEGGFVATETVEGFAVLFEGFQADQGGGRKRARGWSVQ
jgi:hypothetical protein